MPARHTITAATSNVLIDGRDEGADGDGFLFDNATSFDCEAKYFQKGAGAILDRSTKPTFNHADVPKLRYFNASFCKDGVVVRAVDWHTDHLTTHSTFKGHGLDIWAGNLHDNKSKIQSADIGVRVRPNVALCNFQGTEASDSRIGGLIQGNETTLNNWFGEHNSQCGLLVGAKSLMGLIRVNSDRDILSIRPHAGPTTHIDFANRVDPEFGPLCANHSDLIGGHFDVLPGDTAIKANAHMLTIAGVHVNGEATATAFQVDDAIDNLELHIKVYGPSIVINKVGSNCEVFIRYHQVRPRIVLPSDWASNNQFEINGVKQVPGKAA